MNNIDNSLINNTQQNLKAKEDPSKQIKYTALGAGVAYGIGKGVDSLVLSKNCDPTKSIIGRITKRLDNWANNNNVMQFLNNKAASIKQRIVGKHTELLQKPGYKDTVQALKNGSKTKSMLVHEPLAKQLTTQLTDGLKKLPLEKLKEIGIKESVENIQNNPETIKKVIDAAKNGSLKHSNIAKLASKIQMLEHVNKNSSTMSKLLTKFTMGTGNFMGGNLFGTLLMGLFVGTSIKSAMEAPKGEKFSTFMEDLMGSWIGGYLLFSPAGKVVNAIAGLKNIGANVAKLPLWQKALKTIGKVVSSGQGVKGLKALPGGMLRFALVLALTAPFTKVFKKISHTLFGKPTHNDKTKQNQDINNKQNNVNNIYQGKNLFEVARNSASNNSQTQKDQQQVQSYSYLPSTAPANFSQQKQGPSILDIKLKKAEEAENSALEMLKKV
ncbi:MAG: hypothetical protein ACD_20C00435G0016 [uncultured bacterium]|nr:MAG: hypothetical protein ACD_20C00435G0016 [uncultured bacterium]